MPQYLAVQHPLDPATPVFDFWAWRLYRRFIIDRLRAIARHEPPPTASKLTACAMALEVEQFGAPEAALLEAYLAARHPRPARNVADILIALADIMRQRELPIQPHWYLPVIRPDWDKIPFNRSFFAGKIDGVTVHARLPESTNLVPEYAVIWTDHAGRAREPQPVLGTKIGLHLDYAAAIWDWLFARRLTLLCQAGAGPWPNPEALPTVLDGEWRLPARPF